MRFKQTLLVACAALAFGSTAALASTGVTTTSVNMRVGPGTQHAVIIAIPTSQSVSVVACTSSAWCDVAWGSYRGWVSASYIYHPGASYAAPDIVVYQAAPAVPPGVDARHDARVDARVDYRVEQRMDRRWDHWTED